jgi:hypothetical protein
MASQKEEEDAFCFLVTSHAVVVTLLTVVMPPSFPIIHA